MKNNARECDRAKRAEKHAVMEEGSEQFPIANSLKEQLGRDQCRVYGGYLCKISLCLSGLFLSPYGAPSS